MPHIIMILPRRRSALTDCNVSLIVAQALQFVAIDFYIYFQIVKFTLLQFVATFIRAGLSRHGLPTKLNLIISISLEIYRFLAQCMLIQRQC